MRKGIKITLCIFAGFILLVLAVLFCLSVAFGGPSKKEWDAYFENKAVIEASEEIKNLFDWQAYEKFNWQWQIDAVPTQYIMWSDSAMLLLNDSTDFIISVQYDNWNNCFDEEYWVKKDFCYPTLEQTQLYCYTTLSSTGFVMSSLPPQITSADVGFAPALSAEETEQLRHTVFNKPGKRQRDDELLQVWDLPESDWTYENGHPKVIALQWRVEGNVLLWRQKGCLLIDKQGILYVSDNVYHIDKIGFRTRDLYLIPEPAQTAMQTAIAQAGI